MTPFVWMFISSYEQLRKRLIEENVITSLIQLEYSGFDGATVPVCTFTLNKGHISSYLGSYIRLSEFRGAVNQGPKTLEALQNRECGWLYETKPDEFKKIPGSPVAYWASDNIRQAFVNGEPLEKEYTAVVGLQTSDNERFVRFWHEIDFKNFAHPSIEYERDNCKWFPFNKGGEFRKWYGNIDFVVNWESNGQEIKSFKDKNGKLKSRPQNIKYYFRPHASWAKVSSGSFNVRYYPAGFIFADAGISAFSERDEKTKFLIACLNSKPVPEILKSIAPTLNYEAGDVSKTPLMACDREKVDGIVDELICLTKEDWDEFETSWDFVENPLVFWARRESSIKQCFSGLLKKWGNTIDSIRELEEKNNKIFIEEYGLEDEMSCEVMEKEITVDCNPHYRYGKSRFDDQGVARQRSDTIAELLSYSVGCMLGRYSLDQDGLVYAGSDNKNFDQLVDGSFYVTFPVDKDGIIPLTGQEWFPDDVTNRFRDFVRIVWGEEHLQENLDFVAESLCLHAIKPKKGEAALDTIRRYLSTQFYKDHLRTYKKRPIYWLFSSGKQKAFECLVYLHRYNESTLAEMRTDYVIPLTEKLVGYVEKLEQDKEASASAAEAKRIEKELSKLYKQQAELNAFDEKLRHYADQRISLDLDDGVKMNYGKFGDLLAEVKAVTGEKTT